MIQWKLNNLRKLMITNPPYGTTQTIFFAMNKPQHRQPISACFHGERTWTALRVRRPYSALAGNHAVRRETQYNYGSKRKAQIGEEAE